MLTLCLALVCCLSVTAFAQSNFNVTEEYDDDNTWVEAGCSITAYTTLGVIDVETWIGEPYTEASVSYRYIDNGFNLISDEDYHRNKMSSSAYAFFNEYEIYHMVDAYYDFWAEVPTSYGWQEFVLNDVYIEYEIQ